MPERSSWAGSATASCPEEGEEEVERLRQTLRDLAALSVLPAAWTDNEPPQIAANLAGALLGALQPELVYVCLQGWPGSEIIHAARANDCQEEAGRAEEIGRALGSSLLIGTVSPAELGLGSPGSQPLRFISRPIGAEGKWGRVVVAGRGPRFPADEDSLLLSVAANQAASALQEVTARAALQESEARFRTLCATAPVAIYQSDAEGRVLYTNPRWQALSGLTAEESLGYGWNRADHPEDRERVLAAWMEAVEEGKEFFAECRMVTPAGKVRWVQGRAAAIPSREGRPPGYVGTVEEITQLKEAEEALRASEARFRQLSEALEQRVEERTAQLRQAVEALSAEVAEREKAERTSRAQADTLIRTMEQLSQDHTPEEFPGIVLAAISEQLEAATSILVLCDRKTATMRTALVYEGGRIVSPAESGYPGLSAPIEERLDHPDWRRVVLGRRPVVHDVATSTLMPPAIYEHLVAQGVKKLLMVPLSLGDELLGVLSVRLTGATAVAPEKVALAHALAHQATLAIRLARLTEQAREAAVLEEREQAAAQRAAELGRANEALVQTLETLADAPELKRFLGVVIAAVTQQLSAASASLYVSDGSEAMPLELVYEEGRAIPGAESDSPQRSVHREQTSKYWKEITEGRQPFVFDTAALAAMAPASHAYLAARGVKRVVSIPLVLGEEIMGLLNARITDEEPLPPQKIALAMALAHQATLAIRMARLTEQARQTAVLDERNRMAREIHDTLAQAFTGILLQLSSAERLLPGDPARGQTHLQSIRDLAKEGLAEARRSVRALRPQALEQTDLAGALERMVRQLDPQRTRGLQFRLRGASRELSPDAADHLLRIGQEAVTNALRHADATLIRVDLVFERRQVRLRIQDDGRGFQTRSREAGEGFGLKGIRERAGFLGAELYLTSGPKRGTRVEVRLPLPPG